MATVPGDRGAGGHGAWCLQCRWLQCLVFAVPVAVVPVAAVPGGCSAGGRGAGGRSAWWLQCRWLRCRARGTSSPVGSALVAPSSALGLTHSFQNSVGFSVHEYFTIAAEVTIV